VAESCTGGGLGARITAVSGASDVFVGGVISYANEVKARLLGVPNDVLARYGAVSRECAEAMATGVRALIGADWAVSITGVAGPSGGTPEKPVGLVYIGVAGASGTTVIENRFVGDREAIRLRSTQAALTALRQAMLVAE
jgi:PncC family amidohydrolase